jgi:hypothetical protein
LPDEADGYRCTVADAPDLDLLASSLRADAGDTAAFLDALAARLEGAFPGQVEVERKGRLFGAPSTPAASPSASATSTTRSRAPAARSRPGAAASCAASR